MKKIIRNIEHAKVFLLADEVDYLPGQVVSKTLTQNNSHSLTIFAFDKGEEISTHESGGDALLMALDGEGKITIDGKEHILTAGQAIVMPAKVPHAVYGKERFKMLLTVMFAE